MKRLSSTDGMKAILNMPISASQMLIYVGGPTIHTVKNDIREVYNAATESAHERDREILN